MNWYRGSAVTAESSAPRPEGKGKKLRRKLQKIGPPQRWHRSNDHDDAKNFGTTVANTNDSKAVLALPDRDDGKWLEQLRKSGSLCPSQSFVQPNNSKALRHSMQVIPELAHLAINDAKLGTQLDRRASCANPPSASSVTRRYAKTPVRHIGELESRSGRDPRSTARNAPSVERIAESYRALLESSCSILNDTTQEPPLRKGESRRKSVNYNGARAETVEEFPEALLVRTSPHSDDETLVAFEEDSASFKPNSSSLELPSPVEDSRRENAIPPPRRASPGNPSLQICLDLLGQELSSAARGSTLRPSTETSALQVWVMIEAYETLRDKVYDMRLDEEQERSLITMLDTWIKALYAVHDKMTGSDGRESESNYGD